MCNSIISYIQQQSSSSAIIAFSGLTDPPSAYFFVVENELNLFDRNILIALFLYYDLFQIKNSIENRIEQKIIKNQSNMARIYTQHSTRRQSCARYIVGAIWPGVLYRKYPLFFFFYSPRRNIIRRNNNRRPAAYQILFFFFFFICVVCVCVCLSFCFSYKQKNKKNNSWQDLCRHGFPAIKVY